MKEGMDDDEEDEDDDIGPKQRKNRVEPMSRDQMIQCASKLMTLQQGSQQFDNMLDMFGALGFNKQNVKSVLEIEKKQTGSKNGDNYINKNPFRNNNNKSFMDQEDNNGLDLSPIAENEEDVDLFNHKSNGDDQQYTFDDD